MLAPLRLLFVTSTLSVLSLSALSSAVAAADKPSVTDVKITVESGARQTFNGFGTSIGNWTQGYQKLSPDDRERLAQTMWSDLHFNTLRLWVNLNEFSPTPGEKTVSEFKARYIDSGVVADAKRHGVTTLLLAPENLPPYMAVPTSDGRALKADAAEAYAEVVASFIITLRDQAGVVIDVTGLQNEPNDKDHFSDAQLVVIAKRLRQQLDAGGLKQVRIIGPENGSVDGTFYSAVDALHADPEAWKALSAIASHSYNMGATADADRRKDGKEYWMTETSDNGPEVAGDAHRAATLASRYLNDMNHGVTNWIHFLGFETDDPNDNATRIISLKPDGSGWTAFTKYEYYRQLSSAFLPGAVFRHSTSSLDGDMTWTYGKKPRLNAACARNADGTWSLGLSNYTAPGFVEQGDSGKWEIDQEGRPATTCAVTVHIDDLAKAGNVTLDVWRSSQSGMNAAPGQVAMHDGTVTIEVAPFELVTLRSIR